MDVPVARFLQGTPVMAVLDFLERLAPFSTPDMLVRDRSPLMAATEYTDIPVPVGSQETGASPESVASPELNAMVEL